MNAHKESERSVLGAMLRSATATDRATERLRPEDFADPVNREIFSSMMALALGSRKVDLVTLDAELTRRGKLDFIGGPSVLVEIAQSVPSAANVDAYIDIVLEKSKLRSVERIAEAITRRVNMDDADADRLVELIEGACSDITSRAQQRDAGWISGGEAALLAFEAAEQDDKAIPTGFTELDEKLCGGLRRPELTIVGARPGKGKSAFLLTSSMSAVREGFHVGYFSLEMSALQIGQRALASTSLVGITRQRNGKSLSEAEWAALSAGLERLAVDGMNDRMHVYQSYGLTIERLSNIAKHARQRGELDLLVVDYIQLLRTAEKATNDVERLGHISKGLKQLALMLDIPILTAAQVRRQSQDDSKRGGRAPTLDELRGSGDLEQDADNVLLIHSPDNPDDATLKHIDEKHEGIYERASNACAQVFTVEIAKQRQGPTGRTWSLFKPINMRFYEDNAH